MARHRGRGRRLPAHPGLRDLAPRGERRRLHYVVTLYDPYQPLGLTDTKEALWTREDPGAEEVLRDGPVSVFRVDGRSTPRRAATFPTSSPAELDGDSVNEDPLANQPPPAQAPRGTEGEEGS